MIMARTVREPSAEEWEDIARDLYDLVCEQIGWDTEACDEFRRLSAKAHKARSGSGAV